MDENYEWIDDGFRVQETVYGIWHSFDKNGKALITSRTKEICIHATRFYLKGLQEGWDDTNVTIHEGVVGGKL